LLRPPHHVIGEGILRDYVKVPKWFRLAAYQEQGNAQCFLGFMYFEGAVFHRTNVSGYMWLTLAAAGGIEDAAE
jgi:TPR repeat protein